MTPEVDTLLGPKSSTGCSATWRCPEAGRGRPWTPEQPDDAAAAGLHGPNGACPYPRPGRTKASPWIPRSPSRYASEASIWPVEDGLEPPWQLRSRLSPTPGNRIPLHARLALSRIASLFRQVDPMPSQREGRVTAGLCTRPEEGPGQLWLIAVARSTGRGDDSVAVFRPSDQPRDDQNAILKLLVTS